MISLQKTYSLILLLFISSISLHAQKEANQWFLSSKKWVTFDSIPPVKLPPIITPSFLARHSSVVVSDKDGDILFYSTNGRVFNREEVEMSNGISEDEEASPLASQPVFAIPKPNSDSLYCLFITRAYNNDNIENPLFKYLEIDMSLNNGLGEVVPGSIQTLTDNTIDKITAVMHSNEQDIWIIQHKNNSTIFNSWLITEDGVSAPLETDIGSQYIEGSQWNPTGQLKTSPDGTKIASINNQLNILEVFDFDRTTGVLSNVLEITPFMGPQGVEFSPSGRFVYINDLAPLQSTKILQVDLEAGNSFAIINSLEEVGVSNFYSYGVGALQLGPDGKIYSCNRYQDYIGVINYPDLPKEDCGFQMEGVYVDHSNYGLSAIFYKYLTLPYIHYEGQCASSTTTFDIYELFTEPIDSVFWEFDDPTTGVDNFSTDLQPSHDFSGTGAYNVSLTLYSNGRVYSQFTQVNIVPTTLDLGPDQTVCGNVIVDLDASTIFGNHFWSDGTTDGKISINAPGEYWVEVSVDTCPAIMDTIVINHLPIPEVNLGELRGLCNSDTITLDATSTQSNYFWSTFQHSATIEVSSGGTYTVKVTNTIGCVQLDTVHVTHNYVRIDDTQQKNVSCHGTADGIAIIEPHWGPTPYNYLWSDSTTAYRIQNLSGGTYTVTVTDQGHCSVVQEYYITEPPLLDIDINVIADEISDPLPQGIIEVNVSGGIAPYTYQLNDLPETEEPILENIAAGLYEITITDNNGCSEYFMVEIGSYLLNEELEEVKVYPNPTDEFLCVEVPSNHDSEISIYNSIGQLILEDSFIEKNTLVYKFNLAKWNSGIYFVQIRVDDYKKSWKIMVVE